MKERTRLLKHLHRLHCPITGTISGLPLLTWLLCLGLWTSPFQAIGQEVISPLRQFYDAKTRLEIDSLGEDDLFNLEGNRPLDFESMKELCDGEPAQAVVSWIKEDGPYFTGLPDHQAEYPNQRLCSERALRSRPIMPTNGSTIIRYEQIPLKVGMPICDGDTVITWKTVQVLLNTVYTEGRLKGKPAQPRVLGGMSKLAYHKRGESLIEGRLELYNDPNNQMQVLDMGARALDGGAPPFLGSHLSVASVWVADACWSEGIVTVEPGSQHHYELNLPGYDGDTEVIRIEGGLSVELWEPSGMGAGLSKETQEELTVEQESGQAVLDEALIEIKQTSPNASASDWAQPEKGTLRLKLTPRNALLRIDGRPVNHSKRRVEIALLPGNYEVEVSAKGRGTTRTTVEVEAGRSTARMALSAGEPAPTPVPSELPATPTPEPSPIQEPTPPPSKIQGSLPAPLSEDEFAERRGELGLKMIAIPGGSFRMGSEDEDTEAHEDGREFPAHDVSVSPFWMGEMEITNAQYDVCVKAGVCTKPTWERCGVFDKENNEWIWGKVETEDFKLPEHPVVCVDWEQALDFSAWVGGRLPTEAQWAFAARGSEGRRYAWGDSPPAGEGPQRGNFADKSLKDREGEWKYDMVDGYDDSYPYTAPVGSFPDGKTPEGLLDMNGNVREWCEDVWHENYEDAPKDGSAWKVGGESARRVFRGGSWGLSPRWLRSAGRDGNRTDLRDSYLGFRVVVSAPVPPG